MLTSKSRWLAIAGAIAALHALWAPAAPVQEKAGDVVVLHGGIGTDDRAAMERAAADYNLRLKFARVGSGEYLADVRVVVTDAKGGKVVEAVSSGPWLFARLTPGEYSVAASEGTVTLTQKVAIKEGGWRGWVFRFDAPARK